MDKAEEHLQKANLILGENADGTDFKLTDDIKLYQKFLTVMDEYAQQVNREEVINFYISHVNNPPDKKYVLREYNKWKSKQEDK